MAKTHKNVTSSRRKCRKAHLSAPSHIRRKIMSSSLSRELRNKHKIRSLPVRKDDEVSIVRGINKGQTSGAKVLAVYRKKWVIHIDKVSRDRANGTNVRVGIHPSNVIITKLKMTEDRKRIIARCSAAKLKKSKDKSKMTEAETV